MMERLMSETEVYQKGLDKRYNPKYVVQLLNNYRNHPEIIGMANSLFYNDELNCLGPKDTIFRPVTFHNCSGTEMKFKDSPR